MSGSSVAFGACSSSGRAAARAGRVGGVARDGGLSASRRVQRFAFDTAFGSGAAQAAVYAEVAPVVTSVLDGFNVCIFACAPAAPL
jgi:hypothetical protein